MTAWISEGGAISPSRTVVTVVVGAVVVDVGAPVVVVELLVDSPELGTAEVVDGVLVRGVVVTVAVVASPDGIVLPAPPASPAPPHAARNSAVATHPIRRFTTRPPIRRR